MSGERYAFNGEEDRKHGPQIEALVLTRGRFDDTFSTERGLCQFGLVLDTGIPEVSHCIFLQYGRKRFVVILPYAEKKVIEKRWAELRKEYGR